MGRPECANSARWWLSYLGDMHNNNQKHTTKRKCHAFFFHVYLCIGFSIKENENKKNKKKIKKDSTVTVQQQRGPNRAALEIVLDKQCTGEPLDARQFVNSTFTCPLLEVQM